MCAREREEVGNKSGRECSVRLEVVIKARGLPGFYHELCREPLDCQKLPLFLENSSKIRALIFFFPFILLYFPFFLIKINHP